MSEKGGKGGSLLSKGGFPKGKDDSATKSSVKGRRVQFSSEGPFESGISSSHSSLKSGGKGGKGDKVANGGSGKSSKSKDTDSEDYSVDQKVPENIKCLMDCEALEILQGIQEQMIVLSRDSSIKLPITFDKGLQYAKGNSKFIHPQSVRRTLEPLSNHGLTDSEICVIANVCPDTIDELLALFPSLKDKRNIDRQVLKESLSKLYKYKQP